MKPNIKRMLSRTNRVSVGKPPITKEDDGYWYFYDRQGDLMGPYDNPIDARGEALIYYQVLSEGPCEDDLVDPI